MTYQAWLDWKKDTKAGDKFTIPGTQIEAVCDEAKGDYLWITLRGEGEVRVYTHRRISDKPTFFDMLRNLGWKEEKESVDAEELLKLLETEGYLTLKVELEVLNRFINEVIDEKKNNFKLYIERYKVEAKTEAKAAEGFASIKVLKWTINGLSVGTSPLKSALDFRQTVDLWLDLKWDFRRVLKDETLRHASLSNRGLGNEEMDLSKPSKQSMDQGLRYNSGKTRLDLIPCSLIDGVGRVLTFGAQKYEADNWKKFTPQQVKECIGSAMRHIEKYRQGNWLDPESGLPHLAHAAANLGFILELHKEEK